MIRFVQHTGELHSTDLGRTASHFYIKHDTVEVGQHCSHYTTTQPHNTTSHHIALLHMKHDTVEVGQHCSHYTTTQPHNTTSHDTTPHRTTPHHAPLSIKHDTVEVGQCLLTLHYYTTTQPHNTTPLHMKHYTLEASQYCSHYTTTQPHLIT